MNRAEFQQLARIRLEEAQLLVGHGHYSGTYHLAGYAVECALKACIARRTQAEDFPLDRRALENVYTHALEKLLRGADPVAAHQQRVRADPAFETNWLTVQEWTEEARYRVYTQEEVQALLQAITDPPSGIMEWLHRYW